MIINDKKRCNNLTGKEWLQNSFSIWRDLKKTKEEKLYNHPASYPVALCEKLISTFSKKGSIVLDPFNGIGSTTVAAFNLERQGIGIDLSAEYSEVARTRLGNSDKSIRIITGDSYEELDKLPHDSCDLCITSPPYWDILNMKHSADKKEAVNYSNNKHDIGNIDDYLEFIKALGNLFEKVSHVLKKGAYCIVNVMDIRKKNKFYPLHIDIALELQKRGFLLDDIIIWDRQQEYNNMRPLGYPYKYRINKVHEYLLIFIRE